MKDYELESIIDDAFNAAVASIQSAIGQTDGGFAALWFAGAREDNIRAVLSAYVRAEINFAESTPAGRAQAVDMLHKFKEPAQ